MLAEAFLRSGKVRDLYWLASGRLVLIASDRISAFDVVLPTPIPDKGRVLTGVSRFWFGETADIVPNHLLDTNPDLIRDELLFGRGSERSNPGVLRAGELRGRTMICRPATVLPIEAVVRGYLAGSGWKEYRETGRVCGIPLPVGLRDGDRLPQPIFTPATKAELGQHDQNLSFDAMVEHLATSAWARVSRATAGILAERVRDFAFALYRRGARVAERAGIMLADTKFEFGIAWSPDVLGAGPPEERLGGATAGREPERLSGPIEDHVILVDEVMTPDSSRFWDAALYEPGHAQPSFDKQFVRDWLEAQPWNKTAPGPDLPPDVVDGTRRRYIEAFERLTGASFARYLEEDVIAR